MLSSPTFVLVHTTIFKLIYRCNRFGGGEWLFEGNAKEGGSRGEIYHCCSGRVGEWSFEGLLLREMGRGGGRGRFSNTLICPHASAVTMYTSCSSWDNESITPAVLPLLLLELLAERLLLERLCCVVAAFCGTWLFWSWLEEVLGGDSLWFVVEGWDLLAWGCKLSAVGEEESGDGLWDLLVLVGLIRLMMFVILDVREVGLLFLRGGAVGVSGEEEVEDGFLACTLVCGFCMFCAVLGRVVSVRLGCC